MNKTTGENGGGEKTDEVPKQKRAGRGTRRRVNATAMKIEPKDVSTPQQSSSLASFLKDIEVTRPPRQTDITGNNTLVDEQRGPAKQSPSSIRISGPVSFSQSTVIPIHQPSGHTAPPREPHNSSGTNPMKPFYHPSLTLSSAAKYIHSILLAATTACESWLNISPETHISHAAHRTGPLAEILQMQRDLTHIREFLTHGRQGWQLTWLPDNFFADVAGLLVILVAALEHRDQGWEVRSALKSAVECLQGLVEGLKSRRLWEHHQGKEGIEHARLRVQAVERASEEGQRGEHGQGGSPIKVGGKNVEKPGEKSVELAEVCLTSAKVDVEFGKSCGFKSGGGDAAAAKTYTVPRAEFTFGSSSEDVSEDKS